jgi:nucleoside 2-deoxyribosyltransferase
MKIYLAANPGKNFINRQSVIDMMDEIKNAGHTITHDWVSHRPETPEDMTAHRVNAAIKDVEGVREADCLILIDDEFRGGIYTELGVALACYKPVVVVAPKYNMIFFSHPLVKIVNSLKEVLEIIGDDPKFHLTPPNEA